MTDRNDSETQAPASVGHVFLRFSRNRIDNAVRNIDACLERLTDDQLWDRSGDYENSVGNLVLHLEGNLRQFILHTVAGEPDRRRRDHEFSLTTRLPREGLANLFRETVQEVNHTIETLSENDLLTQVDPHTPGWGKMTKLEAIYHAVSHLQLHTGQIIFRTKQLKATDLDLSIPRTR